MNEEKLRDEWIKFAESQLWKSDDNGTAFMGVGNVADWWLERLKNMIEEENKTIKKELKKKWKKYLLDNPQWYRKINNHHYFRSRYTSKFWLEEIDKLLNISDVINKLK